MMQICSSLKLDSVSEAEQSLKKGTSHKQVGLPFHPCMHEDAHDQVARLHLPVAPRCNIHCRFCERKISPYETHVICPGTAASILSPEMAVKKADRFFKQWGQKSIVGIAGPGESLANPETFETLRLIREQYPDARLCLCTNGLNLPDSVETLKNLKMNYLTVTVNGIQPEVVAKIQPWVRKNGCIIKGEEGARLLIENQLTGIKKAVYSGIFVKINTVIVPAINGSHIDTIAQTVKQLGVGLFNLLPLIPRGDFRNMERPCHRYMNELQKKCKNILPVFEKCRQCRADAEGIPGKEICL